MCGSYLCQYTYRCTVNVQDNIIFKYVGLVALYLHIHYFTMNYIIYILHGSICVKFSSRSKNFKMYYYS